MGVFNDWQPLCSLVGGEGVGIEASAMRISDDSTETMDQGLNLPSIDIKNNLWMEEYLAQSNYRLESIAQQVHRGEQIECDSRDWMLNQVDFIVESLGTDPAELDDSLRSRLLQLILAIASLNQHSRTEILAVNDES
jgi:hypothetical protein